MGRAQCQVEDFRSHRQHYRSRFYRTFSLVLLQKLPVLKDFRTVERGARIDGDLTRR